MQQGSGEGRGVTCVRAPYLCVPACIAFRWDGVVS